VIGVHTAAWRCLVALLVALAGPQPRAADRPFLATNSAAAEEDDDGVWSVETWYQRAGAVSALSVAPEYAFSPTTTLQLEYTRERDRDASETTHGFEIEFKHLFNHIRRDGYGWGIVGSLGFDKPQDGGWKRAGFSANVPFSLALWDGAGTLHLNIGARKPRESNREWTAAAALEREVAKRTSLFAEVARAGDVRLLHVGVRWWAVKEKVALDFAVQRLRTGSIDSGVVFGIGFYDL
jgi:hypothetical protein